MDIKDLMSFLYKHDNSHIIKRYILNIKAGDSDSFDRRKSPGVPDAVIAISPITLSLMCHLVQKLTLHFLKKRPCQGSLKRGSTLSLPVPIYKFYHHTFLCC